MTTFDLEQQSVRELNQALHDAHDSTEAFTVLNPRGEHALACGIDAQLQATIKGHAGYYCAGMLQQGQVIVEGNVGVGVAENMMSGRNSVARAKNDSTPSVVHFSPSASARAATEGISGGEGWVTTSTSWPLAISARSAR